jgi:phage-related tail protein
VSQALITEYLKCFNGRTLLTYFYGGVIKYAVDNKVAINSEVRLGDSFSSALATSIGAYKTSHLKAYKQYESAVTEFMGRVCESVKISPPVLKMKELVDRHCNYELKYCTGKHVLRYFAKLAALAGLTEKEKELSKAIEEMRKEPLSFEKFGNSISEILAAQKICDKAVVDAATAPTEAVKAERQQAAQKRFEARCDEIDKENLKLGRSFSEKLIPKLALVTKAVAEASKAALERGAHKLEGLALAALTAIEIFFSEKKSVQMVELVRVGSFEEFIVASELFSDTIKRIALGDTIEIKPELLGDAFETLTLTE